MRSGNHTCNSRNLIAAVSADVDSALQLALRFKALALEKPIGARTHKADGAHTDKKSKPTMAYR
jgi:hypothetical protein